MKMRSPLGDALITDGSRRRSLQPVAGREGRPFHYAIRYDVAPQARQRAAIKRGQKNLAATAVLTSRATPS
jgi:hypothetical protein